MKLPFFPQPHQLSPIAHEVQPQLQPQALIQHLPQSLPVSPTIKNEISINSPCSTASLPPAIPTCAPITTKSTQLPNSPILSCDKPQPQIIPKREVVSPTSFLSPQPASQSVFQFQKPKQRSNSLPVSPKLEPGILPRKKNKKGPVRNGIRSERCAQIFIWRYYIYIFW